MTRTHKNAPLTPEGRRRLCERIDEGRPIAHVADEGGVSRQVMSKWYARWQEHGFPGLQDRSSRPEKQPTATHLDIVDMVLQVRRAEKWGANRIAGYLADVGDGSIHPSPATVHRILVANGISRLRDMDMPTGETKRNVNRYEHKYPGSLVHVDIKKVGRIPEGGGWRIHGRDSEAGRASQRKQNKRVGYSYIHAAVDDHSRLAYVEMLTDEKASTCVGFWLRAVEFFHEHDIHVIERCITDNGPAYRSKFFNQGLAQTNTKHKYTRPHTPRTNGKVERFNLTMKNEWLYKNEYLSDADRLAELPNFLNYYNHDRPHSQLGNKPPASRVPKTTFRVQPQPDVLVTPQLEDLGYDLALFDMPSTTS